MREKYIQMIGCAGSPLPYKILKASKNLRRCNTCNKFFTTKKAKLEFNNQIEFICYHCEKE